MKYEFAGIRPFLEAAMARAIVASAGADLGLSIDKLNSCAPLGRMVSLISQCAGQDIDHIATVLPLVQREVFALETACLAGRLLFENLMNHAQAFPRETHVKEIDFPFLVDREGLGADSLEAGGRSGPRIEGGDGVAQEDAGGKSDAAQGQAIVVPPGGAPPA